MARLTNAGRQATLLLAALLTVSAFGAASANAAPGDLERSFSRDGRVVTDIDNGSKDGVGAAIFYGDRLILAGSSIKAPQGVRLALAGYRSDGSLDPAFGNGGIVLSDAEGGLAAEAIAIDPVGRIVVAGAHQAGGTTGDAAVARLLADGRFDPTFGGGDGVLPLPLQFDVDALRTDGGARIVLAGSARNEGDTDFAVLRLNPDGTPDASFGGTGGIFLDLAPGAPDAAADLFLDPFDRVVLAGGAWLPREGVSRNVGRFALARLHPEGALDTTLRRRGFALIGMNRRGSFATAAAIDNERRAILAGWAPPHVGFIAVRGAGQLDKRFGRAGRAKLDVRSGYLPHDIATDLRGRIVSALGVGIPFTKREGDMLGLRLRQDGTPDRGFSRDGRVSTGFGRWLASAASSVLAPDGDLILAGIAKLPRESDGDFAATRYFSGG